MHPIPIDCECCNALHKLCSCWHIIRGGAIDSHPAIMGESAQGCIGNRTLCGCHIIRGAINSCPIVVGEFDHGYFENNASRYNVAHL